MRSLPVIRTDSAGRRGFLASLLQQRISRLQQDAHGEVGLDARRPFVSLIFPESAPRLPESAKGLGQPAFYDVLRLFVAQLPLEPQPERRPVLDIRRLIIEPLGKDRLGMIEGCDRQALAIEDPVIIHVRASAILYLFLCRRGHHRHCLPVRTKVCSFVDGSPACLQRAGMGQDAACVRVCEHRPSRNTAAC